MSYDNYNDEADDRRPAPKSGMSTGVKVLIGLLVGGGVLCLVCCGVGYYVLSNAFEVVEQPAEVVALSNEIIQIDVPEQFPPQGGMRAGMFGYGMKVVVYGDNQQGGSMLMIMEATLPEGGNAEQQMDEFEQEMKKQGQGGQFEKEDLENQEVEHRDITVRGNPVDFTFIKGTSSDSGEEFHQISGQFPSDNGIVLLMIQVPEAEYDEETIVNMLETIQ